ncbi:MAG: DUF4923 family protein [Bacteroidaceae bacterium]
MKKLLLKGLILSTLFLCTLEGKAQMSDLFNKAKATLTNGTATKNLLSSLIGTKTVTTKNIAGTWSYSKPAIAFESENILSAAGGALAASGIEDKLAESLSKYGITAGQMVLTFNSDKTFTCTVKGYTTKGTYKLDKATITLSPTKIKMGLTANVKITGSNLQITFKADRLLSFVQSINTAHLSSNALTNVSSLIKQFKGVQIGFNFMKK